MLWSLQLEAACDKRFLVSSSAASVLAAQKGTDVGAPDMDGCSGWPDR